MSKRFLRSKRDRAWLWNEAQGKCELCGCALPEDWHADHVQPFSKGGITNRFLMQALCPACNAKKGSSDSGA